MRGFTLVEMLVALLVLALALSGAGALLLDALRAQRSALWQTHALLLAADLAERIRGNPAGRSVYAGEGADAGCDHATCDAAARARQDLFDFRRRALVALPIERDDPAALQIGFLPAGGSVAADEYRVRLAWRDPAQREPAMHEVSLLLAPPS